MLHFILKEFFTKCAIYLGNNQKPCPRTYASRCNILRLEISMSGKKSLKVPYRGKLRNVKKTLICMITRTIQNFRTFLRRIQAREKRWNFKLTEKL